MLMAFVVNISNAQYERPWEELASPEMVLKFSMGTMVSLKSPAVMFKGASKVTDIMHLGYGLGYIYKSGIQNKFLKYNGMRLRIEMLIFPSGVFDGSHIGAAVKYKYINAKSTDWFERASGQFLQELDYTTDAQKVSIVFFWNKYKYIGDRLFVDYGVGIGPAWVKNTYKDIPSGASARNINPVFDPINGGNRTLDFELNFSLGYIIK